jgi:hypothetical protein
MGGAFGEELVSTLNTAVIGLLLAALLACGSRDKPRADSAVRRDSPVSAPVISVDSPPSLPDSVRPETTVVIDSGPPGQMLTPWDTELDSANAARSWFVLRERQTITELIPTRATTGIAERPCDDTGTAVMPAGVKGPWITMVSGIPGLRAGAIEAAVITDDPRRVVTASDSTSFIFRQERFVLRSDSATNGLFRIFMDGKGGQLTLVRAESGENGSWDVLWAGDLNRDGAPDILLRTVGDENVKYERLFMSGNLPPTGRWSPAAASAHYGC